MPLAGNVFNGEDFGIGTFTVSGTFDAGEAANFATVNGQLASELDPDPTSGPTFVGTLEEAQADAGCIAMLETTIEIVETPSQVNCNDLVNISIGAECTTVITPDVVLEGSFDCFDDYEVVLTNSAGVPLTPSNVVDGSNVGQTLNYMLVSPVSGNSCWGEIFVEDKLAPTIVCPADVTLACTVDTDDLTLTGAPDVTDCSDFTVDYYDAVTDNGACAEPFTMNIVRTFVAVDEFGQADSCQQIINIERPDLADVVFPADVVFSCTQVAQFPNLTAGEEFTLGALPNHPDFPTIADATGVTSPIALSNTGAGEPTIDGLPIQGAGSCMLAVLESDEIYDVCGAGFEILRTWKVRDMCAPLGPNNPFESIQIIKVLDETGPEIVTGGNITVSANINQDGSVPCTAAFTIPPAIISDACSEVVSIETIQPFGTNEENGGFIDGLELGVFNITYVAEDACGNMSTATITVTVIDDLAPTPVCDEITDVAIGADGTATVFATDLDDGSFDNCCLDGFLAARMDADSNGDGLPEAADFAEFVTVSCDDIEAGAMVVLQVSDCFGNSNTCMIELVVEDNLAPFKTLDLTDTAIDCDFFFDNLAAPLDIAQANNETDPAVLNELFGTPEFDDNCEVIVTPSFIVDVDNCGEGTISRTFSSVDINGNTGPSCTQIITVNHVNDWEIQFPADMDFVCTEGMNPDESDMFGEPVIFNDDCEMIAISVETTIFDVVPDACYEILRTFTAINWCVYDGDNLQDDISLGNRRFRDIGDGIVVYSQNVSVVDDIAPQITCPVIPVTELDENCVAQVTLPELTDITDCSPNVSVMTSSTLGTGTGPFNNVTAGTYTVTYTATDNCGNNTTCATTFAVADLKAPTPYCVGGLIIELSPEDTDGDGQPDSGTAETWAVDFDAGSFDNCTAQDDLTFLVSLTNDISTAAANGGLVLTCDNVGGQPVYLFVTDEAGNTDVCQTSLEVESVDNVCPANEDELVIAGTLATEYDAVLPGANVSLNTGDNTVSDSEGTYTLTAQANEDVTVTPEYDVYDNSVTTFDLVLIRLHILTTQMLDSPYKVIAADVNGNGAVTAADLVMARQKILGMIDSYPSNTAWVFVDANYEFPSDWTLNDGYPAVVSINNITDDQNDTDFVAVRVGDVNGSFGFAGEADERTGMIIHAEDAELERGEEVTVEFTADKDLAAYQFTLNHAGLLVKAIDGDAENFASFDGALTTSCADATKGKLFAVTFTATESVRLSEALSIDSRITKAEVYDATGTAMHPTLDFGNTADEFAVYQNVPNPFNEATALKFNLPTATSVTFTVSDIRGTVLQTVQGDFAAGINTFVIDNLEASGVLYIQVETPDYTETIKAVRVK